VTIAALILLSVFGAWELYVHASDIDPLLLPAPSEIAVSLVDDRALLASNFLVTAQVVILGITLAIAAGVTLALVLHLSNPVRRALYPLLVASQAVPIVVLAPLLTVWFGYDLGPKLVIVALISFFPVAVVVLDALARTDRDLDRLLASLQAPRGRRLWLVELPAALPAAVSGAKVAVAVAVIGAVFAEYAGSEAGLGHMVLQSIPQLETARAWAAVVVLGVFAIALVATLSAAERFLSPPDPSKGPF
jgi:putative hydroxymethylpyrimidine transport system permease protein